MLSHESRPVPVEFWFEFGSNYSYLAVARIESLAARAGVPLVWRPFLLGPLFKDFGWSTSPFVLHKEKGAYVWQDMVRQCRKYELPWRMPTVFPRVALLPMRVATVGVDQPWMGRFCREMMRRNFATDEDIQSEAVVRDALGCLDLPVDTLLARAQTDEVKATLRARTEEARARGIFGAPTFFVGDEMFWGNDRLDDAIAQARETESRPDVP